MRKRPTDIPDDPLDIFDDDRFTTAMTGATQAVAPASTEAPPHPPNLIPETLPKKAATNPGALPSSPEARSRKGSGSTTAALQALQPELNIALKFRVPQSLRSEFHKFKAELAATLGGVALDDSNLARPLIEIFLIEQADRILEEAASFRGQLKRPPNGDTVGMAEFDHTIGEILRRTRRRRSPTTSSQNTDS